MKTLSPAIAINALLIEDNPVDTTIIKGLLKKFSDVTVSTAENLEQGLQALNSGNYNSILLDLNLPDSAGVNTLVAILIAFPELPVVVLTAGDETELGLLSVKAGAQDFLNKKDLNGALLVHSLRYAIERQKLIIRLKLSTHEIKRLRGLLPLCMHCKKIRNDKEYLAQLEQYFRERSSVKFSRNLCPECSRKTPKSAGRNDAT